MKFPIIVLDEKPIIDYLSMFGHGSDSKDYELAIAVWVKRLFENSTGQSYCIAFELKEDLHTSKPDFDFSKPEHIKDVIEKLRNEYTLIDFLLVKGNANKHEDTGWGFQLKRFGKGIQSNFIQKLNEFIKNKSVVDVEEEGLIVILNPEENMDTTELKFIKDGFNVKLLSDKIRDYKIPYKKVYIFGKKDKNITLTEIFPESNQISMNNC